VDRPADVGPEHRVDAAVLLNPAHTGELGRGDAGPEMVPASGEVGHLGTGAGDRGLDALLQVIGARHEQQRVAGAILSEAMITFTDRGAEKVQEFLSSQGAEIQTAGLRVGVRGGGCSGFQYALAFDTQREGDEVFEDHGLRILVDNPSLPYVRGAVVDYVEGLQGAGFKVDNPNVIAACGCGSSFRVADEEEVSAV
jgi:iron-sulfur cluster assembly protein